jgi:hypothetical protein
VDGGKIFFIKSKTPCKISQQTFWFQEFSTKTHIRMLMLDDNVSGIPVFITQIFWPAEKALPPPLPSECCARGGVVYWWLFSPPKQWVWLWLWKAVRILGLRTFPKKRNLFFVTDPIIQIYIHTDIQIAETHPFFNGSLAGSGNI